MKILPASILAVVSVLVSLTPAAAAERMVTIYAGPSGIMIPAAALTPAPVQPNAALVSEADGTKSPANNETGEARAPLVIMHTALRR